MGHLTRDVDVSWQHRELSQVHVSVDGVPNGGGVVIVVPVRIEEDCETEDQSLERRVETDDDHAIEVLAETVAETGANLEL